MKKGREIILRGHHLPNLSFAFEIFRHGDWDYPAELPKYAAHMLDAWRDNLKDSDEKLDRMALEDYFGPAGKYRTQFLKGTIDLHKKFFEGDRRIPVRLVVGQMDDWCGKCFSNKHCLRQEGTAFERHYIHLVTRVVGKGRIKHLTDGSILTNLGTVRDFLRRVPLDEIEEKELRWWKRGARSQMAESKNFNIGVTPE